MVSHARPVREAKEAAQSVPGEATHVRTKPAFRRFAHLGLGARGVIYLLLAYLAAEIAVTHSSSAQPSASGALDELARPPGGRAIVALLAVGLAGYACWRIAQAISRDTGHGRATQAPERLGWAAIGVLYLALCGRAIALVVSSGHPGAQGGGDASSHPQPWVAMVLRWPAGPLWVGLAGVGLAGAGVGLVVWGVMHDYAKDLDVQRMGQGRLWTARATGIAGEAARGLLVVLVAAYLLAAAINDNPSQAKGTGQALHSFANLPAGPPLLLAGAVGLACFAAYSAFEAFYRKV